MLTVFGQLRIINLEIIVATKKLLSSIFYMKDMGEANYKLKAKICAIFIV